MLLETSEYPEKPVKQFLKKTILLQKCGSSVWLLAEHLDFLMCLFQKVESQINKQHAFAIYFLMLLRLLED